MKYIVIPGDGREVRQLPFYFAVEEYVARHWLDDDYFCIWQVPPTVMLGRNQLMGNEIDRDFCREQGISIYRRKSGGGCVYADDGCLQFSYIISDSDVARVFQQYMQRTVDTLQAAGIGAELAGRNDILIEGHKVAGAAFYRTGQRSVMHNTLLYQTDLQMLDRAVTPPHEKLVSKGVRSVKGRVGNVGDYTTLPLPDFVELARKTLCGDRFRTLTDEEMEEVHRIEQTLASDEFVYGSNPRYTVIRRKHIPDVGYMEAYIEAKNDLICHINLMGDYFLMGDLEHDLFRHLRHTPLRPEALREALAPLPLSSIIRNLDAERFVELLTGTGEKKERKPHVRKPEWLRVQLATNIQYGKTHRIIQRGGLHTICQSGLCPNRAECWRNGTATLMIGGNTCTRNCRFCNTATGRPQPLDPQEPQHVAESVREMKLRYAVITSVDRDDLPDLGAAHWAETIRCIRRENPSTGIEVLIPDFQGRTELIDMVLDEHPDVVGHNMETTRRLTPTVRSVARYEQSLDVLRHIVGRGFTAKTGFMVGLGETAEEVEELMRDIRQTGCSLLTIGQYLQPTAHHLPVEEYIHPDRFGHYKETALALGFRHVESGPLVRSSYHAEAAIQK